MTAFIANTIASSPPKPGQRYIPFVSRNGIVFAPRLDLMPDVFQLEDQLDVGSCVVNGMGSQIESMLKVANRPRDLSRMAWYTMTLDYENRLGQEGLAPQDALHVGYTLGICDESAYPYDPNLRGVKPPQAIYDLAAQTCIERYEAVALFHETYANALKVDRILAALNERMQVGFACQVSDSLRHLEGPWQGHNYIPAGNGEPSIGGHYMDFIGYDLALRMFLVQNSWGTVKADGTPYGDGGFVGLPFSVVGSPYFESWVIRWFDGAEIPEEPGIKLEVANLYRIEARIIPKPAEVGTTVNLWAGAKINGVLHLKTSEADTWQVYDGQMTPFKTLLLEKDNPVKIVNWTNLEQYSGAPVYLAYGRDPFTNWTLAKVCDVPVF